MNDRLQRLEFVSLYELYLRQNEAFRQAVQEQRAPEELEGLRESMTQIYRRMAEKRGYITNMPYLNTHR